jgi:hypothetical protein
MKSVLGFSTGLTTTSHILLRKFSTSFCFQETSTYECKCFTQVPEVAVVQHTAVPLHPVIFLSLISNTYWILSLDWPHDLQQAHR